MAEDAYTLPADDPCATTLQAYKQYLTPLVDDYWQVTQYEAHAPDLSRWQQCCPGSADAVARLRPDKAVVSSPDAIPLPEVFAEDTPCARAIHEQEGYYSGGAGKHWLNHYSWQREEHWKEQYVTVRNQLHSCCVDNFNACLAKTDQPAASGDGPAAASSECLQRFSPDQQLATATPAEAARAVCAAELEQLRQQHTPADIGLLPLAAIALLAGTGLSLLRPPPRRGRLRSAAADALLTLLLFLGLAVFLPDTWPAGLFLALAVAILVTSLSTLMRVWQACFRQDGGLNGLPRLTRPGTRPRRTLRHPRFPLPRPGRDFTPPPDPWQQAPPPPAARAAPVPPAPPAPRAAPAPRERREREDDVVAVDGYTLRPFEESDRQQRIYRCQGCQRFYREDNLQQMLQVTGGTCYGDGCDSTEFGEHPFPLP